MNCDSLGNRMKDYEGVAQTRLTRRLPAIIRLDGKAFHTYTRGMERPWDERFARAMWLTAAHLCEQVQGCRVAYVQSDEISLLLTDWEKRNTQTWFNYEVQKMCSVSAGIASAFFAVNASESGLAGISSRSLPCFDSRCFSLPPADVNNYFLWRQQDASRNSIQALGQHHIGRKRVHGLDNKAIMDRLMLDHGINWNDCPIWARRGVCVVRELYDAPIPEQYLKLGQPDFAMRSRWVPDMDIPIFSQRPDYIGDLINSGGRD